MASAWALKALRTELYASCSSWWILASISVSSYILGYGTEPIAGGLPLPEIRPPRDILFWCCGGKSSSVPAIATNKSRRGNKYTLHTKIQKPNKQQVLWDVANPSITMKLNFNTYDTSSGSFDKFIKIWHQSIEWESEKIRKGDRNLKRLQLHEMHLILTSVGRVFSNKFSKVRTQTALNTHEFNISAIWQAWFKSWPAKRFLLLEQVAILGPISSIRNFESNPSSVPNDLGINLKPPQ